MILAATGLLAYALWGPTSEYAPLLTPGSPNATAQRIDQRPDADLLLPALQTEPTANPAGIQPYPGSRALGSRIDQLDDRIHHFKVWEVASPDPTSVQKHYALQAERIGFENIQRPETESNPTRTPQLIYLKNDQTLVIQMRDFDGLVRVTLWLSYTDDPE